MIWEEGNGTPLQYSCLENPTDGGAWWAVVHGSLRVGHDWATSLSLFTFMYWRRKWQPTPVFLLGESQGWGSLVGCCLWGRTESDTTEVTWQQQQQQQHHVGSPLLWGWRIHMEYGKVVLSRKLRRFHHSFTNHVLLFILKTCSTGLYT